MVDILRFLAVLVFLGGVLSFSSSSRTEDSNAQSVPQTGTTLPTILSPSPSTYPTRVTPKDNSFQEVAVKFFKLVKEHPEFFMGVFLTLFVFAWFGTISAVWKDANARGKPGCLIALMVVLCNFPLGYILWLMFRPAKKVLSQSKQER